MQFDPPLSSGTLIQRYKRFLADIRLDSGETITAHCANPGAMLGLASPGGRVLLSRSTNPARKLAYSWELVEVDFGNGKEWVGINTSHPNALAEQAIRSNLIPELAGYSTLRREVKYGANSRIDILLEHTGRPPCYVEIKNVHFSRKAGHAEFPDCVTARGAKHLGELGAMVAGGARAVMLYVLQMQAETFGFAGDIDPGYVSAFKKAQMAGVEAYAWSCTITPDGIALSRQITLNPP